MRISGAFLNKAGRMTCSAAILFSLAFAAPRLRANAPPDGSSMQGRLAVENGKPAIVDAAGKKTPLESPDDPIAATLADTRLSGKELKLIGRLGADGTFQVEDFYVVHGNTLYRLIYYCDTCHITTFRPGNCMCCQQPTVPTEVPLTDPRVHQEDVKRLLPKR